jgi:hypothetical protein
MATASFAQSGSLNQGSSKTYGDFKVKKEIKVRGTNLPNYDEHLIHFGFLIGVNYHRLRALPSQFFISQVNNAATLRNPVYSINPIGNYGFSTGVIVNLRLQEHFDFRLTPTVAFYTNQVEIKYRNDSTLSELNQNTYSLVEFPFLIKFKSQRRHNTRMYIVAGIKPAIEVGSKRDELGLDRLRLNSRDFSLDFGFGFDFYYPLFKFSPELRFSQGVQDLKYPDQNNSARAIDKLTSRTVTLLMHFE